MPISPVPVFGEEQHASWLMGQQRQLLGQCRAGPQPLPDWVARDPKVLTDDASPPQRRPFTEDARGDIIRRLEADLVELRASWDEGRYTDVRHTMAHIADDLLSIDTRAPIISFFALGGVDLFLRFLCEPPALILPPTAVEGMGLRYNENTVSYFAVISEISRVMTDVIICDTGLSWYIYDRYPCVIYRLLDLMVIPDLALVCCTMLEQMLAHLGPVMEIAKNPALMRVLRSPHDGVLTCGCRITALLVMPTLSAGLTPYEYRQLPAREMVLPFKRVQRVVDSNVLWLVSEPHLVERLIGLSEVRVASGVRIHGRSRTVAVMNQAQDAAVPAERFEELRQALMAAAPSASAPGANAEGNRGGLLQQFSAVLQNVFNGGGMTAAAATAAASQPPSSSSPPSTDVQEAVAAAATAEASLAQNQLSLAREMNAIYEMLNGAVGEGSQEGGRSLAQAPDTSSSGPALARPSPPPHGHESRDPAGPTLLNDAVDGGGGDGPASPAEGEDDWEDATDEEEGDAVDAAPRRWQHGHPMDSETSWGDEEEEGEFAEFEEEELEEEEGEYFDEEEWEEDEEDVGSEEGLWGPGVNEAMDQVRQQDAEEEETKVELWWFLGITDTRERWRLRDPTLTRERDDNVARCFGGATTMAERKAFYEKNQRAMRALGVDLVTAAMGFQRMEINHTIVNSQSEMLYLLNVLLETFFFSEAWRVMKECRWMERANVIFDAVFGLDDSVGMMLDIGAEVHLTESELSLPRFLTFPHDEDDGSAKEERRWEVPAMLRTTPVAERSPLPITAPSPPPTPPSFLGSNLPPAAVAAGTAAPPPLPPASKPLSSPVLEPRELYKMPSMKVIYGKTKAAFATSGPDSAAPQTRHDWYYDDAAQGPDTLRKIELLKGIYEFWNAQDRRECQLLQSEDVTQHALAIARKTCHLILSGKESCPVEDSAFVVVQLYLRSFSHPYGTERCQASAPQSEVASLLMPHLLKMRIYNAVRIPGLPSSLAPRCRLDAIGCVLSELLIYHYHNLRHLNAYVRGSVDLSALNKKGTSGGGHGSGAGGGNGGSGGASHSAHAFIRSKEQEDVARVLAEPPLDREEHEPFASVLLRRMYRFAGESQLIVRALVVSLTPGLRSRHNYLRKHRGETLVALPDDLLARTQTQDLITGTSKRLPYIRRVSRAAVVRLSAITLQRKGQWEEETVAAVGQCLVELLEALADAPTRLPLSERPFPDIFDEGDKDMLRGKVDPAEPGTRAEWALPLFGTAASDVVGLRHLAPLSDIVLGEPHKLVFSMIRPYEAENVEDISFLTVATSSLACVLRVAKLEGVVAGVRRLLEDIRPLAAAEHASWRAETCRARRRTRGNPLTDPATDMCCFCDLSADYVIECPEDAAFYRCTAFGAFGACRALGDGKTYRDYLGGCFYRNYFRVLCAWLGHYATCQRYVEMLFFCTEVAFGEFKSVCLCLLRELPHFFQEPLLLEEDDEQE